VGLGFPTDVLNRGSTDPLEGPHGFAVHNAPIFSGSKVFGHLFEQGKVMIMWACREFAQGDGGITNVRATGDVGIQQ